MTIPSFASIAIAAPFLMASSAQGHAVLMFPMSRQFSNSEWAGHIPNQFEDIEYIPWAFNSGGVKEIMDRGIANVNSDVLDAHGGGYKYPLFYGEFAANGNMLESDEIAKRKFICGDPRLGKDEISYSTPNADWTVPESSKFIKGQVIEMDVVVVYYHYGHIEFSLCDIGDLANPDGVATQECFNNYPLTRAEDDDSASPIDPNYPGRYYVDPPCRAGETEQDFNNDGMPDDRGYESYSVKMRYVLPDIECAQCVLLMHYFTGHRCKHIGYDEFNPPSWPSTCAPNKSDWVITDPNGLTDERGICGISASYPEEFWSCADITIESGSPAEGAVDGSGPSGTTDDEGDASGVAFVDLGCVADTETERIMERMPLEDYQEAEMTVELCFDICSQQGFTYSGTQYGFQCFCGDENTDHLQHGESNDCDYRCSGNPNEDCGGLWSMSVLQVL